MNNIDRVNNIRDKYILYRLKPDINFIFVLLGMKSGVKKTNYM